MKIENIERARVLSELLKSLNRELENAKIMLQKSKNSGFGFLISQHSDMSGDAIDYIYEDGNYCSDIYQRMAQSNYDIIYDKINEIKEEVKGL